MYLSKIEFSPVHLDEMVNILSRGLFYEHQMIWDLLPENKAINRDFLYRRDNSNHLPFYYLLSAREPLKTKSGFCIQTQQYNPQLKAGDRLQFSVRANAVKTIKSNDLHKKLKRRDIIEYKVDEYKNKNTGAVDMPPSAVIHQEAGEEWLKQQGIKCGFELVNLMVENHKYYKIKKPGDPNQRQFTSIDFLGQLRVTEPDNFIEKALLNGVGRSKAYGCGLFLVRRI